MKNYLERQAQVINRALAAVLPKGNSPLEQAMRYAVESGGKRIRPIFVLAAARAVGGNSRRAMPAACAVELVHSYSLVHDDLPCMDDDDFRRGKPTCHKKFGEVTALLAGDALLTLAFGVLAGGPPREAARRLEAVRRLALAAGERGMVGGQSLDMAHQGSATGLATLKTIHERKSGALIAVSAELGAYLGGGSPKAVAAVARYGKAVGLTFQIVDDILDDEGYAKKIGVSGAKNEAAGLVRQAKQSLKGLGRRARPLEAIADYLLARTF